MRPPTDDNAYRAAEAALREALEPDQATVERVARGALARRTSARRRPWLYAVVGAASLALALWLVPAGRQVEPSARPGAAVVSVGSLVLLSGPDMEPWIANAAPPPSAGAPSMLILWKETRP